MFESKRFGSIIIPSRFDPIFDGNFKIAPEYRAVKSPIPPTVKNNLNSPPIVKNNSNSTPIVKNNLDPNTILNPNSPPFMPKTVSPNPNSPPFMPKTGSIKSYSTDYKNKNNISISPNTTSPNSTNSRANNHRSNIPRSTNYPNPSNSRPGLISPHPTKPATNNYYQPSPSPTKSNNNLSSSGPNQTYVPYFKNYEFKSNNTDIARKPAKNKYYYNKRKQ